VQLAFQGKDYFYASVQGEAELVRDRAQMQPHWSPDLDRWFRQGPDMPGIVMLRVEARRVHYWSGEEDGETEL
jgi:general stress protein 26